MSDSPAPKRFYARPPAEWSSMTESEKDDWARELIDSPGVFPPDDDAPDDKSAPSGA